MMPRRQSQEEFIEKSKLIFGNTFDYSKVKYKNSWTPVVIICPLHGEFAIAPKDHLCYKRGCKICAGRTYNTNTFIQKAKSIHGDKFLYDKTIFVGVKKPVIITCKIHGNFEQMPDKHINARHGCPRCDKSAEKSLEYIVQRGTEIHNGFYDYSKSVFTKMFNKIIIICPNHGEFQQTPANHINHKQGCPACAVGKSRKEKLWLDEIGLPNDMQHRTVILHIDGRRFIVDGYNPSTNTIYEFYGDYWHGNPRIYDANDMNNGNKTTFGILHQNTLQRENILQTYGFKIISMWEYDFDNLHNIPHYGETKYKADQRKKK
jgi:hypothetical protein